jgi:hypothetical protein
MVAEGTAAEAVPFKPNGVREQSLPYILSCIREGRHDEVLMGWANAQLRAAGITGRGEKDLDLIRRAAVILDAVRAQTSYAPDPPGSEVIKKPHLLLCLRDRCIPVGDCFPEGTLLLRDDFELIPVEQIKPGDRIWGRDKWTRVEATAYKGSLKVDAVEMNNGSNVFLTSGHKVYVGRCRHGKRATSCSTCSSAREHTEAFDRIEVKDLVEGDVLLQPIKIDFGSGEIDPGRAYIEGLAIADGWAEERRFRIAGRDGKRKEAQKHEVKAICERLGISYRWHPRYIEVQDPAWADRIAQLGSRARFKHLATLNMNERSAEAFLRGIMADSTANTHGSGRTYSTTSRLLMVQTRVLHRMFGRSTSVRMLTPEQHGGAGKHPLWRVGVRAPANKAEKALAVRSIERAVRKMNCWDIQTEDHYVYLPEHDVTVSNCDDLTGATGAAMMSVGIPTYAVHQKFGGDAQEHVLLGVIDELGRKWYIDPSTNDPPYQGSRARSEQWLSPMDVPSKSTGQTGPEFVTLGKVPLYQRPAADPIAAQCGLGMVGLGGFVLPGDILAYRVAWDEYVADSVRVALACAQAMENVASNQTDPAVKSNLQSQAQAIREKASALWQEWNIYAGQTDEFIVLEGAAILQTFQQSVIDAGDLRQSITTGPLACSLTYPKDGQQVVAAAGPDPSVQAEIISHIEGLGILAKGFLQIFVDTSIGGLQSAGTAAQWIAEQSKKVVEKSISSPWPWIVALLIGTGVIGIVYAPEIKAAIKTMKAPKPRRT